MPAPVFYSISMFGTGSVETGAGNITITSGVAVLSVEQTGNIGVGVEIEYNSISCYIAPNRIGFDSGGTAELLPDTKIEDATSGATGIVRFVEVTSGTWGGGDAAGWIYFEKTTGTFGDNNIINRTKPTSSANIATVDGTIEGNIGNGNTEFVVKSAIGADAANQTETAVTSIHHVWATLSAFEGAFTGASYINNADLTAADVVAHCCMYYDHDNYTKDTTAVTLDWSGTTDATRHLVVFAPTGNAESINKQRHSGVLDANKVIFRANSADFTINEDYTELEGLQIEGLKTSGSLTKQTVFFSGGNYGTIKQSIVEGSGQYSGAIAHGIAFGSGADDDITVTNNIVYGFTNNSGNHGIKNDSSGSTGAAVHHNTVYYCGSSGIRWSTSYAQPTKNCVSFVTGDDFRGTLTNVSNCASDDGDGTNPQTLDSTSDYGDEFTDILTGDFSLPVGSICIDNGTSLAASEGIWRDIAGNERGATPDIGAFEYLVAGGYTLTLDSGSFSLTGTDASLEKGSMVIAESGSFVLSGQDANLKQGLKLIAEVGACVLSGQDVGILANRKLVIDSGTFAVVGNNVSLLKGYPLIADSGVLSVSGQDAGLNKGFLLNAENGIYTLSGQSAGLLKNSIISIESGTFNLFGQAVSLLKGYRVSIDLGVYDIAGQDAALLRGLKIGIESGACALTGQDATLIYTPMGGYTLIADSGTYSITGVAVGLLRGYHLGIESGSLILSGQDVSFLKDSKLLAEIGIYSITGQSAALLKGFLMGADSGTFNTIGQDVTLIYTPVGGYTIIADSGAYSIAGQSLNLLKGHHLSIESGSFNVAGSAVDLLRGVLIDIESGLYGVTGQDIALLYGRRLAAEIGAFLLTGQDATLVWSGETAIFTVAQYAEIRRIHRNAMIVDGYF